MINAVKSFNCTCPMEALEKYFEIFNALLFVIDGSGFFDLIV